MVATSRGRLRKRSGRKAKTPEPVFLNVYGAQSPNIYTQFSRKQAQNARFLLSEYERFGLVFT
jgi:hypothetical protein